MERFRASDTDHEKNASSRIEAEYHALDPKLKEGFVKSWAKAVSGTESDAVLPESGAEFIARLEQTIDSSLEGHLDVLAKQQSKELLPLPSLAPEAGADEQLAVLTALTQRIHAVQNGENAGITPRISKDLNGMDCSMSTWIMKHELEKTNIKFAWGMPVGHAVGIIQLADNKLYYADGQNGFVEEIDTDIRQLPQGGHVVEIKNYQEIEGRRPPFFPRYVFVFKNGGVASTINNLDSMLYKQHIGELSDAQKRDYGPDAKIVEQLQPYAIEYQAAMKKFAAGTTVDNKDETSPINLISEKLFLAEGQSHNSPEAQEDTARLKKGWGDFNTRLPSS